jgi:hypothetical protein
MGIRLKDISNLVQKRGNLHTSSYGSGRRAVHAMSIWSDAWTNSTSPDGYSGEVGFWREHACPDVQDDREQWSQYEAYQACGNCIDNKAVDLPDDEMEYDTKD